MASQRIGYVRVSSFDQNPERQLDGIALDKLFTDKAFAKDTKRPNSKSHSTTFVQGTHSSFIPWTGWRVTWKTCSDL